MERVVESSRTTKSNKSTIQRLCDEEFDQLVIDTSYRVTQRGLPPLTLNTDEISTTTTTTEDSTNGDVERRPESSSRLDIDQPKRPMNAFMVWGQAVRQELHHKFSNVQNAVLSKALGRVWRSLRPEEKEPFVLQADIIKANHKRDFPNYRYQPRRVQETRIKSDILISIDLSHHHLQSSAPGDQSQHHPSHVLSRPIDGVDAISRIPLVQNVSTPSTFSSFAPTAVAQKQELQQNYGSSTATSMCHQSECPTCRVSNGTGSGTRGQQTELNERTYTTSISNERDQMQQQQMGYSKRVMGANTNSYHQQYTVYNMHHYQSSQQQQQQQIGSFNSQRTLFTHHDSSYNHPTSSYVGSAQTTKVHENQFIQNHIRSTHGFASGDGRRGHPSHSA